MASAVEGLRPAIKEGFVMVESRKSKTFKLRYVLLKAEALYCFYNSAGMSVKSAIPLGAGTKVLDIEKGPGKGCYFGVSARCDARHTSSALFQGTNLREYHLRTDAQEEKMMWMSAIAFVCMGNIEAALKFSGAKQAPATPSATQNKWEVCSFCNGAIMPKEVIVVDGRKAHAGCFKCAGCSKQLSPADPDGYRKLMEGVYLCLPHYEMEMQIRASEQQTGEAQGQEQGQGQGQGQGDDQKGKYTFDWKTRRWQHGQ
eukprot:m51a1_g11889 hypothetical protein (257) ;mRNA; r:591698-593561